MSDRKRIVLICIFTHLALILSLTVWVTISYGTDVMILLEVMLMCMIILYVFYLFYKLRAASNKVIIEVSKALEDEWKAGNRFQHDELIREVKAIKEHIADRMKVVPEPIHVDGAKTTITRKISLE